MRAADSVASSLCTLSRARIEGDLCFPLTKTYMEVGKSETELEETAGDLPVP